jgi:hypothetical protein
MKRVFCRMGKASKHTKLKQQGAAKGDILLARDIHPGINNSFLIITQ